MPTPYIPSRASTSQQASSAFLKRIVENKVKFKSKAFPSCFYKDGTYDAKNLDQGLLRGEVIPRVLRHVWTGPKSGIDGSSDGLPNDCNALAHNIVRVSPEMIGYGACQARTMLATKDWAERDGEYDYNELFTKVVDLFADPDDPWVKETLDWYQNQVFGNAAANIPQAGSDDESDGEEDIMTQRAARRDFFLPLHDNENKNALLYPLLARYSVSLITRSQPVNVPHNPSVSTMPSVTATGSVDSNLAAV
ncbi:hypothetical protein B0H13DRAFT_1912562 [Mycena leptocephala]|nr:hypothetical protein B0H13DRAFT_1912562 [Mycena leptocephala]